MDKVDYIIVAVSDMERSVRFYRDQLGLMLKYETKEWTEFKTGDTTLALHPARESSQKSTATGEMVAGNCSIGFNVPDIEESYKKLQEKDVHFVMPPKEREGETIKLAVLLDPDGLPISLSQAIEPAQKRETPQVTA